MRILRKILIGINIIVTLFLLVFFIDINFLNEDYGKLYEANRILKERQKKTRRNI